MNTVRISGLVVDWDEINEDSILIQPDEITSYESGGYTVVQTQGSLVACRIRPFDDGVVQIQPKSDMKGRVASAGGHLNYGLSGYFKGFVYLGGRRKALVDWWEIFPNKEHHFISQQDKAAARLRISSIVGSWSGKDVVKVSRGYAFAPAAYIERLAAKRGLCN